jgi:gluconolactonase
VQILAEGLEFPEGPVANSDGSLLVCEIKSGHIARVAPDGSITRVATTGPGPNGAAVGPDGKLYVCMNGGFSWSTTPDGLTMPGSGLGRGGSIAPDYKTGGIQVVDLDTGEAKDLYTKVGDYNLSGPNDIVFDQHGGFYFSDNGKRRDRNMDYGGLYYGKIDGSEVRELVYPLIAANGVGLSPANDRVYVAETTTARVWAWDVSGPGELAPGSGQGPLGGELIHTVPRYGLLDSLAVEAGGNICLATLHHAAITVISPVGEVVEVVSVTDDDPAVTNICFGGEDMQTAYITTSGRGRLYVTDWGRPGLTLNYNL